MERNETIVLAQADFAVSLLQKLASKDPTSSMIVSPTSVAIALAMAYAGARGQTAVEIGNLIAKGEKESELHKYFATLLQNVTEPDKDYTLEVANCVYVGEKFPLQQSYKELLNTHYLGQFRSVDFGKPAEAAKTHNKISGVVDQHSLDALTTRLFLINTIYFKGTWYSPFEPRMTKKEPFYHSPGREIQVDMMHQKESFCYEETTEYQVLQMGYKGLIRMSIVLPKERYGLDTLLSNLSGAAFTHIARENNLQRSEVIVSLPRFKLESTHNLTETLKSLGVVKAFDTNEADFTGISTAVGGLNISGMIQKAYIETNEEGSEAAAATGMCCIMDCLSDTSEPHVFNADHPFIYMLTNYDGDMLFCGVVREP